MDFTKKEPWLCWFSDRFHPRHQFDAWDSALNESHLEWKLNKPVSTQFSGEIKMRQLGGVRIVHCKCEPCGGVRTRREIGRSKDAFFGLLFILSGSELVKCHDQTAVLEKGTLLLWDSTQPVEFNLLDTLDKVTLFISHDQLRTRVPQIEPFVGKPINVDSGIGAITAAHVISLAHESDFIENGCGDSLVDLTLELIATCLQAQVPRPLTKARRRLLSDIKIYIDRYLEDPGLTPNSISKHFDISTRYLHLLFEDMGISVSKWIQRKRLEQCRRNLLRIKRYKPKVTEVAFQWGFNDSAHFSRVFKEFYGLSPLAYQKRHFS